MNTPELEARRKKVETLVKVAGLGVAGFLVAPVVFLAIKGLIGLIIAGGIGLGIVFFTPVIASKMANWRLQAIKAEAAKNPVETLQNEYKRRAEDLHGFNEKLRTFIAKVSSFADKVKAYKSKYPDEASDFESQLRNMRALLDLRKQKFLEAQQNLAQFSGAIERAKDKWDMSQAALAMALAAGQTEQEFFAKIQVETALDSVQQSLNTAFADLELSLIEEDKPVKQDFQRVADLGGEQSKSTPERQKITV